MTGIYIYIYVDHIYDWLQETNLGNNLFRFLSLHSHRHTHINICIIFIFYIINILSYIINILYHFCYTIYRSLLSFQPNKLVKNVICKGVAL